MTGYTVVLIDSSNAKNGKAVNGRKAIGEFNSTKGEIVLDIGSDNVVAYRSAQSYSLCKNQRTDTV